MTKPIRVELKDAFEIAVRASGPLINTPDHSAAWERGFIFVLRALGYQPMAGFKQADGRRFYSLVPYQSPQEDKTRCAK